MLQISAIKATITIPPNRTSGRAMSWLVKSVGKPDGRSGNVRFDERGREQPAACRPDQVLFLDVVTNTVERFHADQ